MKTDVIVVSDSAAQMDAALREVDRVAVYKGLKGKSALHLRLLTEEMMGLMRSITGADEAKFWIQDDNNRYELHLQVYTRMTSEKRDQLLDVSTSGKNESARGLMGRLRDFFDRGTDEDVSNMSPMLTQGMFEHTSTPTLDWEWSLSTYEEAISQAVAREDVGAKEAWDELEKSVVAHVADDIKIYIRGEKVEMVILKKFA